MAIKPLKIDLPKARRDELRKSVEDSLPFVVKEKDDRELTRVYADYVEYEEWWNRFRKGIYRFFDRSGKEREIDVTSANIKGVISIQGGTEDDITKAISMRQEVALPYLSYLKQLRGIAEGVVRDKLDLSILLVECSDTILHWFGSYMTVDDAHKMLKDWKINISVKDLKIFYVRYKSEIEARRKIFIQQNREFRVATEAGRLEVLNDLLTTYQLKFNREQKQIYSSEIIKILEQARKECKGEQLYLTVDGKIDIAATVHGIENTKISLQRLPVNVIVIGLVAAKMGLSPYTLVGQLCSSYYKDYSGFGKTLLSTGDIQLPGDIIRNTDWSVLKERSQQWIEDVKPIQEVIEVSDTKEAEVIEDKRSRLLSLLRERTEREVKLIEGSIETRLSDVDKNRGVSDKLKKEKKLRPLLEKKKSSIKKVPKNIRKKKDDK